MAKDNKDKKSPKESRPSKPAVMAMAPPPTPPGAPESPAPMAAMAAPATPEVAPNLEDDFEGEDGALRFAKKCLERQVAQEAVEAAARKANGIH